MESHWIWWVAALVLVIAEISTGTFYLLAVALGLAVAGLAAYMGAGWNVQAAIATLLCSASVAGIYLWNRRHTNSHGQSNFSNDIGQTVRIASWSDERHARVSYRGAEWDAELTDNSAVDVTRQTWRIREISGSRLIIE